MSLSLILNHKDRDMAGTPQQEEEEEGEGLEQEADEGPTFKAPTPKKNSLPPKRASSRLEAKKHLQHSSSGEGVITRSRASASLKNPQVKKIGEANYHQNGGRLQPALAAIPLWKQFAEEYARKKASPEMRQEVKQQKLQKQQRILRHIALTRSSQEGGTVPPVFAIISGPTIRPYRMEELSLTLGRVTPHHRVTFARTKRGEGGREERRECMVYG